MCVCVCRVCVYVCKIGKLSLFRAKQWSRLAEFVLAVSLSHRSGESTPFFKAAILSGSSMRG